MELFKQLPNIDPINRPKILLIAVDNTINESPVDITEIKKLAGILKIIRITSYLYTINW